MHALLRSMYWLAVIAAAPRLVPAEGPTAGTSDVLATVNGAPVRAADLELLYLLRRIPENQQTAVRERCIDELIEQRLMSAFLTSRRTEADPVEVDARIAGLRAALMRGGKDPDAELQRLGITPDMLRGALALPLAWQQHLRRVVTADQLAEHWAAYHARYDGTRRRISQIVLTWPPDASDATRQAALARLQQLRSDIDAGRTAFADAARTHSQSPSKEQGGNVGWVVYGTRLPREIADVAFAVSLNTLSEPFTTRFGAHLILVTGEEPGDLSLEDVRSEVLADLGRHLWNEQLAKEKGSAKIVHTSRQ
jgi:hypothetical protein